VKHGPPFCHRTQPSLSFEIIPPSLTDTGSEMESASMNSLSPELLAEISSYLDFVDLHRTFSTCRQWYYARPFILRITIKNRIQWLQGCERQQMIPRRELQSHNAFLKIINGTYTLARPTEEMLDLLVELYTQEMISAWFVPINEFGAEKLINDSHDDMRLYHRRYPHLLRLGMILRWNYAGQKIAQKIEKWLEMNWERIKGEEKVQRWVNPNYDLPPPEEDLGPHQTTILRGVEFLAIYPIIYYAPQDAAAEDPASRLNAESWTHPGFDRLKLWLSIPELWNLKIRHEEIKCLYNPYRVFCRIVARPLIHIVLYRAAEYVGFSFQLFTYLRSIELSTPTPELIRGTRYWYEEGYCGSVLHWNFHLFSFPGQYISLFKRPFVDLIRGYIRLYGPYNLSDFVLNLVYFMHRRSLPIRTVVARTVMSELLVYGYEFLSDAAIDAVVGLMRDESGTLITGYRVRDYPGEPQQPQGGKES